MSSSRFQRLRTLFLRARALPPGQRAAFLLEACHDADLRAEVEALLVFDAESVTRPADEDLSDARPLPEWMGPFRIRGLLGRGGAGIVYRAMTRDGTEVALKILAGDAFSESLLRRFRLEANLLARLTHPGIARLVDSGTIGTGAEARPYLAIELIEGPDIRTWSEAPGRTDRERCELLARVADAVHAAHLEGAVHRDLKPAHILVRPDGSPCVLDFGVAHFTGSDLRATMPPTDSGVLLGTVAYMSPEQAGARPGEIGPASDVYTLGIIAYEVFEARLPYALPDHSLHRALVGVLTLPPAPLQRTRGPVAERLEAVLMRALEKDPARRYPTAAALASDLRAAPDRRRSLLASSGSLARLRWHARRHRSSVRAASLLITLTAAGLTGALSTPGRRWIEALARPDQVALEACARIDSAETIVHASVRTRAGLRSAIGQLERAWSDLAKVRGRAYAADLRRHTAFRLGEARYILASWDLDADGLIEATHWWNRALRPERPIGHVPALPDSALPLRSRLAYAGTTPVLNALATAHTEIADFRDPLRNLRRALAYREQALDLIETRAANERAAEGQVSDYTATERLHTYNQIGATLNALSEITGDSTSAMRALYSVQIANGIRSAGRPAYLEWPARASIMANLGEAYRCAAVTCGRADGLDSARVILEHALDLRRHLAGNKSQFDTRLELARTYRALARRHHTLAERRRWTTAAETTLVGAFPAMDREDPATLRAMIEIGLAAVRIDRAAIERHAAALVAVDSLLDVAEKRIDRIRAPRPMAELYRQRARSAMIRRALGGNEGDAQRARLYAVTATMLMPVDRDPRFAETVGNTLYESLPIPDDLLGFPYD